MLAVLIVIWAIAYTTEGACWTLDYTEKGHEYCRNNVHSHRVEFACFQYAICNDCGIQYGANRTVCDDMYFTTLKSIFCLMFKNKIRQTFNQCIQEGKYLLPQIQQNVPYKEIPRPYCREKWVEPCFHYY